MTQREWPERLAQSIAEGLRRYREMRGMSAQQLSDACTEAGMPIARSVIANFENGRRASIGVAELLVFAKVLNVPPVNLICPVGYSSSMEAVPGDTCDPYAAALWISGENPIREDGDYAEEFFDNPLPVVRALVEVISELAEVNGEIAEVRPEAEARSAELASAEAYKDYAEVTYRQLTEAQRELMQKIRAGEDVYPQGGFRDKASEAYTELMNAIDRLTEVGEAQSKLDSWLRVKDEYEMEARDLIDKIRARDWVLPHIGAEYEYLLQPAEPERPSRRRARKGREITGR